MGKNFTHFSSQLWGWMILTPLRLCTGWIIFSAFWRRIVLKPQSLDVLSPEYEGLKFNHFIASATGITSMIEYLTLHPQLLYIFMWVFTIVEGLIGLGLLLGFFTRVASFVSFFLILGIMLGAGWLGTTCVDEWQIGVFGIAASAVLFIGGAGILSLDHFLTARYKSFQKHLWGFLGSGPFFTKDDGRKTYWLTLFLSLVVFSITLVTNQINVGGVWGPFHNKAIKPHLQLSDLVLTENGDLKMTIFRDAGPDTYGSFLVDVRIVNEQGETVLDFDSTNLGKLPLDHIQNHYLVKVQPNGQSLVIPLGALSTIQLTPSKPQHLPKGNYFVEATDIDQSTWKAPVHISSAEKSR